MHIAMSALIVCRKGMKFSWQTRIIFYFSIVFFWRRKNTDVPRTWAAHGSFFVRNERRICINFWAHPWPSGLFCQYWRFTKGLWKHKKSVNLSLSFHLRSSRICPVPSNEQRTEPTPIWYTIWCYPGTKRHVMARTKKRCHDITHLNWVGE